MAADTTAVKMSDLLTTHESRVCGMSKELIEFVRDVKPFGADKNTEHITAQLKNLRTEVAKLRLDQWVFRFETFQKDIYALTSNNEDVIIKLIPDTNYIDCKQQTWVSKKYTQGQREIIFKSLYKLKPPQILKVGQFLKISKIKAGKFIVLTKHKCLFKVFLFSSYFIFIAVPYNDCYIIGRIKRKTYQKNKQRTENFRIFIFSEYSCERIENHSLKKKKQAINGKERWHILAPVELFVVGQLGFGIARKFMKKKECTTFALNEDCNMLWVYYTEIAWSLTMTVAALYLLHLQPDTRKVYLKRFSSFNKLLFVACCWILLLISSVVYISITKSALFFL
ncbi:hypothetical protein RFI_16985, partial [Reticulomyxa filosa]